MRRKCHRYGASSPLIDATRKSILHRNERRLDDGRSGSTVRIGSKATTRPVHPERGTPGIDQDQLAVEDGRLRGELGESLHHARQEVGVFRAVA